MHSPHLGLALHIARPCDMQSTWTAKRRSGGILLSSCSAFRSVRRPPDAYPRRLKTRQTWASTGSEGASQAYRETHFATFFPTPGSLQR
jgi:hypothetical protein